MSDELLKQRVEEQLRRTMQRLNDSLNKDRLMATFDAIAAECVRLKIESWDQIPLAELRERLRVARVQEREVLGQHKAESKA